MTSVQVLVEIIREQILFRKCTFCGGTNHSGEKYSKNIRKDKEKDHAAGDSDRQRTERKYCKCFRCGSVHHLIAKCPKPPKENKKTMKDPPFQ